jgi:hypothetical protein
MNGTEDTMTSQQKSTTSPRRELALAELQVVIGGTSVRLSDMPFTKGTDQSTPKLLKG